MKIYQGKAVFKRIVIGKVFYYEKAKLTVKREKILDAANEWKCFDEAKEEAKEQLLQLHQKAVREVGEAEAAIFEVHMMMLDDDDYCDSVKNIIVNQELCAEYAVAVTGDNFSQMFQTMDDEYMKARAADVLDISDRLIGILSGSHADISTMDEPMILAADDLAPSETVQMDKSKILGFATRYGSANSHTAILARTMNIPALIGVEIEKEWDGKLAVLDGYKGEIVIDPDPEYLAAAQQRLQEEQRRQILLRELKGKETITKDGRKIHLYANIGSVSDTGIALQNDAEGIGLFRSEFLYLEAKDFPDENEQFLAYKTVAENMAGKKVIIRTLDLGADKQADYFQLEAEENPALGYRAIRICLTQPDIFKTQLRAILRASAFGNIAVMFPMIISLSELQRAKAILEEVKAELKVQDIAYRDIDVGVMIETPAAVMISRELAKEVDYFSIGTNDLTQYTLAIDRQNPKLDQFYDAHHPAVLEMIRITINNGHEEGIWVGICGELGADTELTKTFLQMGIDEFSVSPAVLLEVRDKIRQCN